MVTEQWTVEICKGFLGEFEEEIRRGCVSLKKHKSQGKAVELIVNAVARRITRKTFVNISSKNSASGHLFPALPILWSALVSDTSFCSGPGVACIYGSDLSFRLQYNNGFTLIILGKFYKLTAIGQHSQSCINIINILPHGGEMLSIRQEYCT
jgi:hypothetical protein